MKKKIILFPILAVSYFNTPIYASDSEEINLRSKRLRIIEEESDIDNLNLKF